MRLGWLAWAAFILRHFAPRISRHRPVALPTPGARCRENPGLALDIRCLFAYTRARPGVDLWAMTGGSVRENRLGFMGRVGEKCGRTPKSWVAGGSEPGIENQG
jgi:hypothetical protein